MNKQTTAKKEEEKKRNKQTKRKRKKKVARVVKRKTLKCFQPHALHDPAKSRGPGGRHTDLALGETSCLLTQDPEMSG